MNDLDPRPALDLEALIRARLERDAERIDPRPLFERIMAGAAPATPRTARRTGRRTWQWAGAAAAAAVLVGAVLVLLPQERPALAHGATLVRQSRQAHRQPIDRCYLVAVRRESSLLAEVAPTTPQVRTTRLWTRGDRFWVESARPEARWAWGRDEANRFWIAFGPHTAVRLDADEVPAWLNVYCDLHSLNVERFLDEVSSGFELTRETAPGDASPAAIRVHAQARTLALKFPSIDTVDLELDAETRVVRRMVVHRVWNGEPFATVTYTLAETDVRDPSAYQLEGHLTAPAEIFTRDHEPQRRKELLARWFGPQSGRRPRPREAAPR